MIVVGSKLRGGKTLSAALDRLAALYPDGALRAATDPEAFVQDVAGELERLRRVDEVLTQVAEVLSSGGLTDYDAVMRALRLIHEVRRG